MDIVGATDLIEMRLREFRGLAPNFYIGRLAPSKSTDHGDNPPPPIPSTFSLLSPFINVKTKN